jgi:hypothetical protein
MLHASGTRRKSFLDHCWFMRKIEDGIESRRESDQRRGGCIAFLVHLHVEKEFAVLQGLEQFLLVAIGACGRGSRNQLFKQVGCHFGDAAGSKIDESYS